MSCNISHAAFQVSKDNRFYEKNAVNCIHFEETENCNNLQPVAGMLKNILQERYLQKPVYRISVNKDCILSKYYRPKMIASKLPQCIVSNLPVEYASFPSPTPRRYCPLTTK